MAQALVGSLLQSTTGVGASHCARSEVGSSSGKQQWETALQLELQRGAGTDLLAPPQTEGERAPAFQGSSRSLSRHHPLTEPAALTIQPAVAHVAHHSVLGAAWQVAQPLAGSLLQSTAGGGATHCGSTAGEAVSWQQQGQQFGWDLCWSRIGGSSKVQ